ncbi:MAG: porin [Sulfurospirillum sp.]|nr:porin [Sulfurospirillum sp.]
MKKISRVAALVLLSVATLDASGYRIPEQSLNSTALSAAYVAGANGADASYYNPANMAFMGDGASLETALTYIRLTSISYTDTLPAAVGLNGDSKVENFIMPTFHYVSPKQGNLRYGLSVVAPGGLSKRWDEAYGKAYAQEFSLKIIELNPTISYMLHDKFAIGFGLRGVYTDGVVKSDNGAGASRDLSGDSIDFGYNMALSYKAMENVTLSTTYRSKIDLTVDGEATLAGGAYRGGAKVEVPLPAALTLAAAYTIDKTTVEFVFERTYWSSYKELDFNYDVDLRATALAPFDNPIIKNWKDVNAYRIGVTHQYSDTLKLMAGFAIDKNPIPDGYVGFELPDSDAKLYSLGFEYKLDKQMSLGLAYLYDDKESRSVTQRIDSADPKTGLSGTFEDASAHLVTASFKYKF